MNVVGALFRLAVATFALVGTKEIWLQGSGDDLVYFTNQAGLMLAVAMIWAAPGVVQGRGPIEPHRRIARGYRNRHNCRLQMLLFGGASMSRPYRESDEPGRGNPRGRPRNQRAGEPHPNRKSEGPH